MPDAKKLVSYAGLLFIPVALQVTAASAQSADAPPAERVLACPWTPPDAEDIDKPQAQLDAENESKDKPTDDSSTAGDSDSDAGPGIYIPGNGCILIDGSVDAGVEATSVTVKGSRLTPPTKSGMTQWQLADTLNITHYSQTDYGDLITRLGIEGDQSNNISLSSASVTLGRNVIGLETSFFADWQADEFSFRALATTQSPFLVAQVSRPTPNTTLTLSLEDPTFRRVTISGYGSPQFPDLVGRFRYTIGNWQFIANAASHQTTFFDGSPPLWGAGVQAYARYAFANEAQDDKSYVIFQLARAWNAPGYLGINTPTSAFKISLPGALGANDAERADGWNGAAVVSWAWSSKWRSAAFASFTSLTLPDLLGTVSVLSTRGAANLTYTPVENLDLTLEAGLAKVTSTNSGIPSARQWSLSFSMSRTFP
ncbi:hypothetical protein [Mesorhizobium sp. NZP2077]|uniref:hypothetical protein n=1 Tax=Mesorhizobium sp. NZP2077 TaxID=2483404 RepID=UPI001552CC16|nr:hypothetical protein [Mesorhizobium sp. NZP2077]QKC83438.1 hypothetical protein EB232_19085 [Mesorhizobium sp. NZP2077]QKD16967.1 hypothetical protein HGP13_18860 [Mesorhizobium sp. NZP2077]